MKLDKQQPQRPYFVRFLESQELERIAAGRPPTRKYPSDTDEDFLLGYPTAAGAGE